MQLTSVTSLSIQSSYSVHLAKRFSAAKQVYQSLAKRFIAAKQDCKLSASVQLKLLYRAKRFIAAKQRVKRFSAATTFIDLAKRFIAAKQNHSH